MGEPYYGVHRGMKKIGLLTWHYYENFGSALQAFALQDTLEKLGHNVAVINYRNPKFGVTKEWKRELQYLLNRLLPSYFSYPFLYFQKKYLKETRMTYDEFEVRDLLRDKDLLVFGSDQIWAPNVFNPIYMGEYCGENAEKISYAASIGLNDIPDDLRSKYSTLLSSYKSILVREKKGKELLKQLCNVEAEVVLDPTLLVPVEIYEKMEMKSDTDCSDYVFCYFLNANNNYRNQVEQFCKKNGLIPIGVSARNQDNEWMKIVKNIGPQHFLYLIHNVRAVFTDSYHGTIFSLLYHKDFYLFERFSSTDVICQNSRINQLAEWFNISHRIISGSTDLSKVEKVDYIRFEKDLRAARDYSIERLKEGIK